MTQQNTKRPFRLVFRRSSMLLKCVVLAAVVLSTVTLVTVNAVTQQIQEQTQAYREQASRLEQDNQQLECCISQLGTVNGVKRIANEELGLVDPDDCFFKPVDSTNPE